MIQNEASSEYFVYTCEIMYKDNMLITAAQWIMFKLAWQHWRVCDNNNLEIYALRRFVRRVV